MIETKKEKKGNWFNVIQWLFVIGIFIYFYITVQQEQDTQWRTMGTAATCWKYGYDTGAYLPETHEQICKTSTIEEDFGRVPLSYAMANPIGGIHEVEMSCKNGLFGVECK